MKIYTYIAVLVFISTPCLAASDDFGSRFTGRAPSALELPSLESRLQDISPAAGGDQISGYPPFPQSIANTMDQPSILSSAPSAQSATKDTSQIP
jgi:hypothetical protein